MSAERAVLIADEDPEVSALLVPVLGRGGYAAQVAPSARSALDCLRAAAFDLLILDLLLPDTFGLCLLSIVRRLYPRLPVLVVTADDSLEHTLRALQLGACGYLQKPIDSEQVLYCVGEIFKEIPPRPRVARQAAARLQRERAGRGQRARRRGDPDEDL